MLTFPTLAYEYNLPSLVGFVPLIIYWAETPNNPTNVPARDIIKYSFFTFVFLASFSNFIHQGVVIMGEYFLIASILLIFPMINKNKEAAIQSSR